MAAEPRPRRAIRPASKLPIEITSARITVDGSLSNGIGNEAPHKVTNGKRSAPVDDENLISSSGGMEAAAEKSEKASRSKGGKGKNRASKSNSAGEKLYDIEFILTNPKSPLVNMDISDVINHDSWMALSPESRERLCKLLPSIAFGERIEGLDDFHPSQRQNKEQFADVRQKDVGASHINGAVSPVKGERQQSSHRADSLDPLFFKDPHFESAVKTFQDHLFTGWFTSSHRELVEKHLTGIRSGSVHAPWKDEIWDKDHPEDIEDVTGVDGMAIDASDSTVVGTGKRRGKEKGACEFDLLVRKGFVKQGDIIALKHKFTALGITIEKDALVSAIHPKTSAVTLTLSAGTTQDLPPALLVPFPSGPTDLASLREMTVQNATQFVTSVLDIDGRIPRDQRPRMDSWKLLNLWQWPADTDLGSMSPEEAMLLERGGREPLGTLFYLRGQAVDD